MMAKTLLLALLVLAGVPFLLVWTRDLRQRWGKGAGTPSPFEFGLGFFTNFFDTLGIGSFSPSTAAYRMKKNVADPDIPGTLNIGHYLPTLVQAFIFVKGVDVGAVTLWGMIIAAIAGAWLGAGVVLRISKQHMQLGMGVALLGASAIILLKQLEVLPRGGTALSLDMPKLAIAFGANFVFGALMNLGIGLYAPCMIAVALLGMDPKAAFPIMMGSCAFLQPVASLRFVAHGRYSAKAALGLSLGGIPAVLLAAYIVKELPLKTLQWIVFGVALYTAQGLLRAGRGSAANQAK
jgi:uncharacterized membrane protein YfcA